MTFFVTKKILLCTNAISIQRSSGCYHIMKTISHPLGLKIPLRSKYTRLSTNIVKRETLQDLRVFYSSAFSPTDGQWAPSKSKCVLFFLSFFYIFISLLNAVSFSMLMHSFTIMMRYTPYTIHHASNETEQCSGSLDHPTCTS